MAKVDYRYTSLHERKGLPIGKQLARESEPPGPQLPLFFNHMKTRLSVDHPTKSTIKDNNYENTPFMDPIS